jgi:predicted phage terminase large subunit-like protein
MKLSRHAFLRSLGELSASYRAKIEAEVDGFDADPAAMRARVAQARDDFEFFARTYFPHYVQAEPSVFHRWLFANFARLVGGKGRKQALAAPRGEAKSTLVTQIGVLWCVVTERKHYVPIIMDAFEQAATMLEAIKAELEVNPRLRADFPHAAGAGRVWNAGVIVTANGRKVQAFGSGKRMRGLRHGPHRPDLVICDDIENDENVRSPEQRDKLMAWLTKTVLSLGKADDTLDVVVLGTLLLADSVLARLLANPLWERQTFRALIRWPDRMDLWQEWEELLRNDGEAAAQAYYAKHAATMERGAEVSWPAQRPLYVLMVKRARDGHRAFDSEMQNDPVSSDDNPFAAPGKIQFWVAPCERWVFFGACDPSLGKTNRSRDPSALLVGGFERKTGVLDVVEASIARRVPDKIIEDVIKLQAKWDCLVWGVEAVQFQEFLRTELVKRSAARGIPVPARPIVPHADKALRIESLEPHVANGLIRLHPAQQTLHDQLRHWPDGDHDDGPDALQMLWLLAMSWGGPVDFASVGPARSASRHYADYLG